MSGGKAASPPPPVNAARVHQSMRSSDPQLAGIPSYTTCCRDASLFCQTFSFVEPGIPGACPQPSLCLPLPEVRRAPPPFLLALSHLRTDSNAWLLQGCGRAEGSPCCPPSSAGAGDYWCAAGLTCKGAAGLDTSYPSFLCLQSEREGAAVVAWEVALQCSVKMPHKNQGRQTLLARRALHTGMAVWPPPLQAATPPFQPRALGRACAAAEHF